MSVKHIRLNTGENIIYKEVKTLSENPDTLMMEDPAMIIQQRNADNQVMVALAPYMPFLKSTTILVSKNQIVSPPQDIDENLENEYLKQFSLIQIANPSQIVLN